jgi:hypothetical protein
MHSTQKPLVQSIRLTGNGFSVRLRIDRSRPQDLEEFLRENDLTDRIDFDTNVPVSLTPETPAAPRQLTAA